MIMGAWLRRTSNLLFDRGWQGDESPGGDSRRWRQGSDEETGSWRKRRDDRVRRIEVECWDLEFELVQEKVSQLTKGNNGNGHWLEEEKGKEQWWDKEKSMNMKSSWCCLALFEGVPYDRVNSRGSSEYSDQSYEYPIGEASPNSSPMQYRARSLTPPPDRRDYIPQPQPLSYTELNRLPVVKLQDNERHIKCCCDKPWEKDEEVTQLLCGHKLHSTCACKLMDTGVCPICKSADVIEDKLREIRIDLSGFNF